MMPSPTGNEEISRASMAPRSSTSSLRPPRWSPSPLPASAAEATGGVLPPVPFSVPVEPK